MKQRAIVLALLSTMLTYGCSGGGGGKKAADKLGASGDGGAASIKPGDAIDLDGDGIIDGIAVDIDGDGVVDGVDTDGDGTVDSQIPDDATVVPRDGGSGGPIDGGPGTYVPPDGGHPFPVNDAGQVLCGSVPCQCSDGIDNDMDGVTDLADPECVSPWDNDESSLATGISGDNRDDACQDCFFDGNSGAGDDGCRIPSSCLTKGDNSSGRGSCNSCEASDRCKNFCEDYTPNGCDCFGCCAVNLGSGITKNVLLGGGCSIDGTTLDGCTECVPSTSCKNECGECELCPGKTLQDLPAKCFTTTPPDGDGGTGTPPGTDPPAYTCDNGEQVCGSGLPACDAGYLCQFGCCVLSPILI